jgi:hypothetical protein
VQGGDSARYATTVAKRHLLQLSPLVPITIKPRGNKEAEIIEGTGEIATKLSTVPSAYKEYITVVYDKYIRGNGTCKCIINIQTDVTTSDAMALWEQYLTKANVRLTVITESEVIKEDMRKALWISGVQPRQCNKAAVKQNIERLLSEKGKEMPIEVIDCYHALPVEVTENGVVSTQKIGTKVLAIKTRKEDIAVLVGNLSKMINHDKVNIFNEPSEIMGIVNPHPVVHAIPFRASNRYQHILLSKHKKFMDARQAPFFLQEDIDRVIPATRLNAYIHTHPQLTTEDNTLRRVIMSLTNDSGNQAAEAIYSTHRSDFIVSCLRQDSKVIADFCDLHALMYKNMWDKFDPNYESDLTKEMKALVAEIDLEEDGFYMAPGKTVEPSQIVPSAWTKKPNIVTTTPSTPAAIRAELKRTEDSLAKNMSTELQKITNNHEQQIRTIEENHRISMNMLLTKLEELQVHSNQQGSMINDLLMRNDNDQAQMTEGFAKIDKIDKNVTANEASIEHLCHDTLTAIETHSKGQHMVTRALQQGMETTAKSFKIITDEMLCIKSEIDEMSHQADMIEEALEKSCEQVDYIFKTFEEQSSLHRGRDKGKNKRNRSRSASSTRSTMSNTTSRWSKKRQTEIHIPDEDSLSGTGESLSHSDDDDNGMGLDNVQEEDGDELELSELEREDAAHESSDDSMAPPESTVVSGSPQDAGSRRD